VTTSRAIARAVAALAAPSIAAWCALVACEPQDIYLFDAASTQTPVDGGASPPPSEPEANPPAMNPDAPLPTPISQPACESAACDGCVEQGSCNAVGAMLFCHPQTARCSLPCDADAPQQAGNCPAPERCDPRLGLCVECVVNADCNGLLPRSICDPSSARCVQCNSDLDCRATGQVCLTTEQSCVQCVSDEDCIGLDDSLLRCLPGEQSCVECVSDADCTTDPERTICSSLGECEDSLNDD
jgi:hypothetical protein